MGRTETIKIDLRNLDYVNPGSSRVPLTGGSPISPWSGLQAGLLKNAATRMGNKSLVDLANGGYQTHILPPKTTPIISRMGLTVGVGCTAGFNVVGGRSVGAGFYASTTGEIGTYSTSAYTLATNIGASVGVEWTIILGPPSNFSGNSNAYGIDCDIDILSWAGPLPGYSLSGRLIYHDPSGVFLGFSLAFSGGISVLPLNIVVEKQHTNTKPRFQLW
ncbi:MAG: hypothetical protein R2681_17210 [Pyrinomonadaceae bacterium]